MFWIYDRIKILKGDPLFRYDRHLYIPEIDLWIDSTHVKPFGFVSHAHTDHLARHKKILCTPATEAFARYRIKNPHAFVTLDFGETLTIDHYQISLHPAGHILGSAQILISKKGQRLLYSGDFHIQQSPVAEAFEFVQADVLIMETTFGKPLYQMPPRQQVEDQLIELCKQQLKQGKTPVVFGYSLGKGQEALKILTDAGLPVEVDESITRFLPVYEQNGIRFGAYKQFNPDKWGNSVILLPTHFRYQHRYRNLRNAYTIYLSGWGMDRDAQYRFGVDKVLPLSDHADYNQLLQLVETVNPSEVYCTHGFPEFVDDLNAAGFRAKVLE